MKIFGIILILLLPLPLLAESGATYDFHAALALTGIASSFGIVENNGAQLAVEEFNATSTIDGKKVRLVVEDTQSTNIQSLNAIRKLTSINGAKVVLGPTWLDSYQSVLPIVDREGIFLITPSAATAVFKKSAEQNPHVFSTGFNLGIQIEMLLRHVKSQGHSRIAVVVDTDPYFQSIGELVKKMAPPIGLEVVSDNNVDLNAADFRSILTKIKAAKADCGVFGFGEEKNLLTFMKQRGEIAPNLRLYGTDYLDGYVYQDGWVGLFNNVDFASPQVRDKSFAEKYKARFGAAPILTASNAYDATKILLNALASGINNAKAMREYLLSKEFDTMTFGKARFNTDGSVQSSDFVIKKVRNKVVSEH